MYRSTNNEVSKEVNNVKNEKNEIVKREIWFFCNLTTLMRRFSIF